MLVILDSTVLVGDRLLRSNDMQLLLTAARRGGLRLAISAVTYRETINNTREQAQDALDKMAGAAASLRRLRVPTTDFVTELTAESVASDYELFLQRELDRHRVGVLPIPPISHEVIVERALARRKPFDKKGHVGYRDALIWETIRIVAETEREIAFVSANHRDFAEGSAGSGLARSLSDELAETARVELWSGLSPFVARHVLPATEVVNDLRRRLREDQDFLAAVRLQLKAALDTDDADVSGIDPRVLIDADGEAYDLEEARLELQEVGQTSLDVVNAHVLDDDQVLLDLDAVIRASVEFWLRRARWDPSQHEELLGELGQGPPESVRGASVYDLGLRLEGTFRRSLSSIETLRLVAVWTLSEPTEDQSRRFREFRAREPVRREWEHRAYAAATRWCSNQSFEPYGGLSNYERFHGEQGSVLIEYVFESEEIRRLRGAAERLAVMRQMIDPNARAVIVTRTRLHTELADQLARSLEPQIELYVMVDDELA